MTTRDELVVWLRDVLCGVSDKACFGCVAWSGAAVWRRVRELGFGCEVFGDNLVRRSDIQHTLAPGVVGLV